ncbi:MAG: cysteine desulfurase [Bacteroidia bacterium]|nr:cysteine desulfurase [Bacteroidia bacterium]
MQVYLDNAATTPLDKDVLEAMLPYMTEHFGNPSSIHSFGRKTRSAIEQARKTVASYLQVSPSEIFFTSGGTEANNTAIQASIYDLGITHAISSPIEHHAVTHTLEAMEKRGVIKLSWVKILPSGHVDLDHLEELLANNDRSFISLMHANNEIGNLLNLKKVSELAQQYQAILHTDTVQTMGHYGFNLQDTKVHFLSCAAHKFHGPKGVGFLYVNSEIKINPLIYGGAQERNMRGGTENLYGIIGLAKALEIANSHLQEHIDQISGIKNYMIERLEATFPDIKFNGDAKGRSLYTVLNVSLPPSAKAEMLLFSLDIAGIAASGGSACSSGTEIGSHVLRAIQVDPARPSVRFSFSKFTTKEEIDYTVEQLAKIYEIEPIAYS